MVVIKQLDDEDMSIGECSSLLISLPEFVVTVSISLTEFFSSSCMKMELNKGIKIYIYFFFSNDYCAAVFKRTAAAKDI
jgi:hypothetical protein